MTAEEAFNSYHEAVFRFVYRMTQQAHAAEDVTQECFLAFVRTPHRFNPARGTLKAYLFSIARNVALKQYRDRWAEMPIENDSIAAVDPRSDIEVASAVAEAVAALPALQREALILFQYEGCTLEEIAAIAGADLGTVKSRLHRARERLKKSLVAYRNVGGIHGTA